MFFNLPKVEASKAFRHRQNAHKFDDLSIS